MVGPWREERAELDAVLQSGIFARAPNLESFLRYICEHQFRGQAEQLKEYSIAIEALSRPSDFNPKNDSIVRVEAHRLRKRLADYYNGPGAGHAFHILIPKGTYAPQFVAQSVSTSDAATDHVALEPVAEQPVELAPIPSEAVPPPEMVETPTSLPEFRPTFLNSLRARSRWLLVLVVIAVAAGFVAIRWRSGLESLASQSGADVWQSVPGQVAPAEFRILAGYHGIPLHDIQGHEWQPDAYYSGGRSIRLSKDLAIECLQIPHFLTTARTGSFHYDIPVNEGVFEIHLYFAETEYGVGTRNGGGDGSRMFRLRINGRTLLNLFDIHAEAGGPNRLFVRVFKDVSRGTDGKIHIAFDSVTQAALLNAIEILPTESGRIRPIRIVAQGHPVTDSNGRIWSADEYVVGGTLVLRKDAKFENRNFVVYQGERYGNFTYHIPLATGKYRVTLHFAETWFGTPHAPVSATDHRLFDVYANGLALVRNFDVLSEAGAPNKGIEKVFDGMEPNAQGELNLQFVPLANYAEVNAIEVVETD